jgi:heat shock protein 1/8
LGSFKLEGIPPQPRGVPVIEITYDIDANGILNVYAVEKSTGKTQKITITNDKNRMSAEDIEKLVKDAEKFKEQDEIIRKKIESKNKLENYVYSLKSSILDEKVSSSLSQDDKDIINKEIENTLNWLNQNPNAEIESYENKQKELEKIISPIMNKSGTDTGSSGGMDFSNIPGMEEMMKNTTKQDSDVKIEEID